MRKENKNSFHLAEDHKLTGEKQKKTMGKGFKTALVVHVWTSLSVTSPTGIYRVNGCKDYLSWCTSYSYKRAYLLLGVLHPFHTKFCEGTSDRFCKYTVLSGALGAGWGLGVHRAEEKQLIMRGCPRENLDGILRKRSSVDISRIAFLQVTLSHQHCKEWHKQACKTSNRH